MFGKARNEEIHQQGKYLKLKIPSHFFQVLKMWKSSDFKFSQVHMKGTLHSKISFFVGWNPFREKKLDSKDFLTFFSDSWVQCQDVCARKTILYTHFYTGEEEITWVLKMLRRQTSWVVIPGSNFKMATPCLGQQNNRLEDQIRKGTVENGSLNFSCRSETNL